MNAALSTIEKAPVTLGDLLSVLTTHPDAAIHLVLPDESQVPAHFHITEVGRVRKDFVDCGGTVRRTESCVLQVWVAGDLHHRLDTTKLAKIVDKGAALFESTAIPLEVEFDNGVISQYPVLGIAASDAGLVLQLSAKHAACLAPDRCGVKLEILSSCSEPGCC